MPRTGTVLCCPAIQLYTSLGTFGSTGIPLGVNLGGSQVPLSRFVLSLASSEEGGGTGVAGVPFMSFITDLATSLRMPVALPVK